MGISNFVKRLAIQSKVKSKQLVINEPEWADVILAISGLDTGDISFFELSESTYEASVMTVYGNSGIYHISLISNETTQSWLHFEPINNNREAIDGNLFPSHQICRESELAKSIIHCFFEIGAISPKAEWFTIDLVE